MAEVKCMLANSAICRHARNEHAVYVAFRFSMTMAENHLALLSYGIGWR